MFTQLIDAWSDDLAWVWVSTVPRQALLMLGVALLVRSQPRMAAAWRHWMWLVAALAMGLVPLAAMLLPGLPLIPAEWIYGTDAMAVGKVSESAELLNGAMTSFAVQEPPSFGWGEWCFVIWAGGALLLLARLAMGMLGLRSLQRGRMPVYQGRLCARLERCRRLAGVSTLVDLYVSKRSPLPMTWGVVRPVINIPEEAEQWSDERLDAVFLHELAHIQRADCWSNMVLKVVCALNWFNPFVWMAAQRTYLAQEVACDDFACSRLRPSNYARHLLELTAVVKDFGRAEIEPAVGLSSCDHLRFRVAAALDPERSRAFLPSRIASMMSGAVFLSMGLMAMVSLRFVDEAQAQIQPISQVPATSLETGDAVVDSLSAEDSEGTGSLGVWLKGFPASLEQLLLRRVEADERLAESSLYVPVVEPLDELVVPLIARSEVDARLSANGSVPMRAEATPLRPVVRAVVVASPVVPRPMPAAKPKPALRVPPPVFREDEIDWRGFSRPVGHRRGRTIVLSHAESVCNRYARMSASDRKRQGGFRNYLRRNGVNLSDAGLKRLISRTTRHQF